MIKILFVATLSFLNLKLHAQPYTADQIAKGQIHAQHYPVDISGSIAPYHPFKILADSKAHVFANLALPRRPDSKLENFFDFIEWIGLLPYPSENDDGVYSVAYPNGQKPDYPFGFRLIEKNGAIGFTMSCAQCHAGRLFGKTVLGLTNRWTRANQAFYLVKKSMKVVTPFWLQTLSQSTKEEKELYKRTRNNMQSIGIRLPQSTGLDTSLAQVALSLNHRNPDDWATKSEKFEKHPRPDDLDINPADSKPLVWWNVKYKNRWLADGSVKSNNPIFTNILWNEIGRGSDLKELDQWLDQNQKVITELTAAVMSSQAPKFTDFFDANHFDPEKVYKGEKIFNQLCSRCHGTYVKAWSLSNTNEYTWKQQVETIEVKYPKNTFSIDIGTDPYRYLGMKSLTKLNDLSISKKYSTLVEPQKGYVPPPLVGIWARWPYFHNNSSPTLCSVLTKSSDRPTAYYMMDSEDPSTEFDSVCNGYPLGDKVDQKWQKKYFKYDSTKKGLSNAGHDEGIFLNQGKEILSSHEKLALIQFLQTL